MNRLHAGQTRLDCCIHSTNTAVNLARSMVEDAKSTFKKNCGAIRMLQIYYASQCITEGATKAYKQQPGDMNFAIFKIADAMVWPVYTLLDAFSRMHKINPHPEMKPGFYSVCNLPSNRNKKSDRESFMEDKMLLLKMLPEFYFHCRTTKPNLSPVENEFTRLLRAMLKTKEVTLPLVFAATLFLDIHHMLRDEVDYGFERLTDAKYFVIGGCIKTINARSHSA